MKFFYISILAFISSVACSQDRKFAVSTNILNVAASGPSVAFSYKATSRFSYQLYASQGKIPIDNYRFRTTIFDVKYSFWDCFYVGPYLRYIEKRVQREGFIDNTGFFSISGRDFNGKGISSGMSLGLKYNELKRVNLEVFAGLGYGRFIKQIDYVSPQDHHQAFPDARIGFLVGYRW